MSWLAWLSWLATAGSRFVGVPADVCTVADPLVRPVAFCDGSKGAGASIPANAPLVFVVDLLGV